MKTEKFKNLIPDNFSLEKIYSGTIWAEGPVWIKDKNLIVWSDVKSNKMLSYDAETGVVSDFRNPSEFNNGNCTDISGRLISCQHGKRRVVRQEKNGELSVIADNYNYKKLNSPNDVAVSKSGNIWFTDPPYGILTNQEGHKSESEQDGNHLYRVDQKLNIKKIDAKFDKPNGLVFSPDGKILYVADSGAAEPGNFNLSRPHNIQKFILDNEENVLTKEIFVEIENGFPDGMTVDINGNLFVCDPNGMKIHIFDPSSERLGHIDIPERVANCTFGGHNKSDLYITASTSLYKLKTNTNGL
ncbi:MAG: SMP-30/gluconolactonase/LRE family protein [Chloroflexi bacterium]|nr:SMP-30/gluconolactonase/LRE family protein [Chloroflexota bacterium]|tara:strand:+ start:216 stop:1115 length:900 start_codon:yes stop_codon:yes gene_type:complete